MVTCRSRQVIESPAEAGVGSTLISVGVGKGDGTGTTDSPVEEQAVKTNSPISSICGVLFMGSIGYRSNCNTYIWLPVSLNLILKYLSKSGISLRIWDAGWQ